MSLAKKIVLIVSLLILGAVVTAVLIIQSDVRSLIENEISSYQRQSASQTMDKIDRFLYERTIDVQAISSSPQFSQTLTTQTVKSTADAVKTLNYVKTFDGVWDSLNLIDAKGKLIASTDPVFLTQADANTVKGALDEALTGKTSSSDVFRSSDNQPAQYFFAPVRSADNGKVLGVISGRLAWPSVIEITNGLKNSSIVLLNKQGVEVGNNDSYGEIFNNDQGKTAAFKLMKGSKNPAGSFIIDGFDGKKKPLVAYSKEAGYLEYRGYGWYLVSSVPTSKIFAPVQNAVVTLVLIFAGSMLAALLLILVFMQRQVVRPILRLSHAVEGITQGDWSRRVKITSKDEMGQLGEAFNTMASQLSLASSALAEEKARLEASINSLPLGFMLTDSKNAIMTMNPPLRQIVGLKSSDDTTAAKPITLELLEVILSESSACLKKKKPTTLNHATKQGRFLRLFFSPILEHGHGIGVVTLVEDITEAKLLERSKDEFFSIASHELRTPLTAIRGNTSMMRQYYKKELKDKDLNQMVSDIHESSTRLIEIVNDFLDASRLEQGKMEFKAQPVDIMAIIESVAYELAGMMKERNLYLKTNKTTKSLPLVLADRDRVKQILYNLTGNALKFTTTGGITIDTAIVGKHMKIRVIDTGKGIPDDKQSLLFRKFQQAGNSIFTRDSTRGTGLGLYISKLLTENMGGKLELESSVEGKGSVFSFSLPLAPKGATVPVSKPR